MSDAGEAPGPIDLLRPPVEPVRQEAARVVRPARPRWENGLATDGG